MVLSHDNVKDTITYSCLIVFEDLLFGGLEGHILEFDSEWSFDRVLMEDG